MPPIVGTKKKREPGLKRVPKTDTSHINADRIPKHRKSTAPRPPLVRPELQAKRKASRPNMKVYDREACLTRICEALATSEDGLHKIVEDAAGELPQVTTFWVWMREDEYAKVHGGPFINMAQRYATAKAQQTHFIAENMLRIADEDPATNRFNEVDSGAVRHQDLRVKTRQWLMERLNSRVYGNKTILASDIDAPLAGKKQDLSKLTSVELEALLKLQEKMES